MNEASNPEFKNESMPPSFIKGLEDVEAGRVIELDQALTQPYPKRYTIKPLDWQPGNWKGQPCIKAMNYLVGRHIDAETKVVHFCFLAGRLFPCASEEHGKQMCEEFYTKQTEERLIEVSK